jgi:predicted  nucleic acid-binding Zn-ribbon protein
MDSLLSRKPAQLTNERREMFELIDRFSTSVYEYKRQYLSTIDKRNNDLQQRRKDKEETLKKLKARQKDEQKKALNDHNGVVASIDKQIRDCQSRAAASIREQEEHLSKYENGEKSSLNAAYNADESRIRNYRETRKKLSDELSRVEVILGQTFTGVSKLKKICDSFEPKKQTIATQSDALKAVDKSMVDEAELLYEKIKDITESLPKKVIFNKKRTSYIKMLVEMKEAVQEAVIWLEVQSKKEQQLRKKKCDDNCSAARKKCNQSKQSIISQRDTALKTLHEKLDAEKKRYHDLSSQLQAMHSAKTNEQDKYYETQISNALKKWESEIVRCNKSFAAMMEEQYPADRLNAWMKLFWYHPRKVEEYGKVMFVQMNTLIGMANIDISDWYSGETGVVIKNILTRYPLLFGPDRESATHAYKDAEFVVPYSISLEEGTSLLISYDDASDERAKSILNAVGMRLLRTAPPCQMRFQLIDADGIGAFGRLMALDPAAGNNPSEPTVKSFAIGEGGQVHSTKADIASQIAETKITMDDLSRQLTNYSSIREFNVNNPLSKQIYRPILMMNFPMGLGTDQIRTLNAMASDCSRWGFSMVLAQPDKALQTSKPEIQAAVKELQHNLLCLRMDSNNRGLKIEISKSIAEKKANILLFGLPDNTFIPSIAKEIRRESVEASSVLIRFTDAKGVCPEKSEWFSAKADDGIVVPVGYLEGGQPFKLQFDDKHVHTVIMGNTGSGKTNLLHVLMTNTMLRYSPDEVMIYLIDFKYGLDFRMYTQFNLPNFRTISINNDPEFALAMLQNLEKEQQDRSTRMGSRYQKISEYNAANPGDHLNRIILIVDELYELAKQASDDVQKSILKKIDSFAHQTRAFGIHMVVCGQDLDKIENFETIKNQCTTRLALHCEDEQVKMLMDDAGVARMHTIDSNDQGACVFSLSNGSNPQIEHTTYLGAEQQEKVLSTIHKHYLDKKQITGVKVLLTKVSDNPNHILQMFISNGHIADLEINRLVIGEPISMERELNLRPTGNLWITGGASGTSPDAINAGNSIMFFSAMSLMLSKIKYKNIDILCTNCCDHPMRDIEEEEKDLIGQLASTQDKYFKYSNGEKTRETMNALLDQLSKRKTNKGLCSTAIWWFVVRPEMLDEKINDSSFVIGIKELLSDGPKVNIHTVLWNADIKAAQKFQIEKTMFKDRICLEMTSEESKIINGSEMKQMPEGFKAVLISNNTMRLRVYDLPDGKWMNALFDRLKKLNGTD